MIKKKNNLVMSAIDNAVSIILGADSDHNNSLSEEEISLVISKLEEMNHKKFNKELLHKKIIEYGSDVNGTMQLINDMFDEDPSLEAYYERLSIKNTKKYNK